ncbi:MAG: L-threonylcarbamoyladenylate synthase [Rhodobacterales bacterium]
MAGLKTEILPDDADGIEKAARIICAGGLVAFPTETVYGLGADARNSTAIATVYAAKGRPAFNPLIVHVANLAQAKHFARFAPIALKLATAFWPGPLSLVLPLKSGHGLSDLVTAGLDTVAIRVPKHPSAQALLTAFNGPIAAPSANPSGRISPTSAAHVKADMYGKIDAIMQSSPCFVGVESSIVKVHDNQVSLLRAGGISLEQIRLVSGQDIALPDDPKTPQSPGQLHSHYAPNAKVRLNATTLNGHEILLGFGPDSPKAALNLSPEGDTTEAAANLFSYLRKMDHMAASTGAKTIAISPIPMSDLGLAINDRLKRAAAPRV